MLVNFACNPEGLGAVRSIWGKSFRKVFTVNLREVKSSVAYAKCIQGKFALRSNYPKFRGSDVGLKMEKTLCLWNLIGIS